MAEHKCRESNARACWECEGEGTVTRREKHWADTITFTEACPECHGTGRKPDTFRDDGATTPEGCEDPDDRGGEVPGA